MRNSIISLFYRPMKNSLFLLDTMVLWALLLTAVLPTLNIPYDGQVLVYMLMEIRNNLISGGTVV